MKKWERKVRKREVSDVDYRIVDLRRVTRVVAGGRRFSFRVTVVAGDKKGRVGIGVAKGSDTAAAIEKALRLAKESMINVPVTKSKSIPHEVEVKYASSRVIMRPGRKGRGLVAGSSVRIVLELAGIEDVSAKVISRSTNKLNNARAALEALKLLKENVKYAASPTSSKS